MYVIFHLPFQMFKSRCVVPLSNETPLYKEFRSCT